MLLLAAKKAIVPLLLVAAAGVKKFFSGLGKKAPAPSAAGTPPTE
jgi:hypothetical protein